jgi:hypothetical protein
MASFATSPLNYLRFEEDPVTPGLNVILLGAGTPATMKARWYAVGQVHFGQRSRREIERIENIETTGFGLETGDD